MKNLQKFIDFIRLKKNPLYDYIWNKKIKDNYLIVPIGKFCFPRTIATLCHLKRLKKYGEKTYPFDLAFYRDFDKIIELIDTNFSNFYTNLKFENNEYINSYYNAEFNHDGFLNTQQFKERYDNRINNFYHDIKNEDKNIIFICASFKPITKKQIIHFIKVIKKYRQNKFKILIIHCNCENQEQYNLNFVHVINNIDINSINYDDGWINRLRSKSNKTSRDIVNKCKNEMIKIIKTF